MKKIYALLTLALVLISAPAQAELVLDPPASSSGVVNFTTDLENSSELFTNNVGLTSHLQTFAPAAATGGKENSIKITADSFTSNWVDRVIKEGELYVYQVFDGESRLVSKTTFIASDVNPLLADTFIDLSGIAETNSGVIELELDFVVGRFVQKSSLSVLEGWNTKVRYYSKALENELFRSCTEAQDDISYDKCLALFFSKVDFVINDKVAPVTRNTNGNFVINLDQN